MMMKKLVSIGVVALVILVCVITAGCTSTTTMQQVEHDDPIEGSWNARFTDEAGHDVECRLTVLSTGHAMVHQAYKSGDVIVRDDLLSWTKNADGTYAITMSDGSSHTWTLNPAKDKFTSSSGHIFTREGKESSAAA